MTHFFFRSRFRDAIHELPGVELIGGSDRVHVAPRLFGAAAPHGLAVANQVAFDKGRFYFFWVNALNQLFARLRKLGLGVLAPRNTSITAFRIVASTVVFIWRLPTLIFDLTQVVPPVRVDHISRLIAPAYFPDF